MLKKRVYLVLIAAFLVASTIMVLRIADTSESDDVQMIIWQKGQSTFLDNESPHFLPVLQESESLFVTANSTYRLIVSNERIHEIRREQAALEIIYPEVQTEKLRDRSVVHFTKLLIPLSGEFSNGTVFFAGAYAYTLGETKPEYSLLSEYGSINVVLNTQGVDKLKGIVRQMSARID